MTSFNGLGMGLGNLSRLSDAETRSISAENTTGAPGAGAMATEGTGKNAARDLGQGWKVSPSVVIAAGTNFTMADITGPGVIEHIWLTCTPKAWRSLMLSITWDREQTPSVLTPVGDFFCNGWCQRSNVVSLPVAVNPAGGMNCYWEMPFRQAARIDLRNIGTEDVVVYYQVDYALTEIPEDCAYLHASFRRVNPLPYQQEYVIVDGVTGQGHYVGTYLAWGVNNNGWWGEGEIKFYLDDDGQFPTICGTGTEDYFGGAWNFEFPTGSYGVFNNIFSGMNQAIGGDGLYQSQQRFSLYRWHIMDPIRFKKQLRVTIQALGWRSGGRYLPLQDDIASVAFWYQKEPHAALAPLPDADHLEVI